MLDERTDGTRAEQPASADIDQVKAYIAERVKF